MRRVIYRNELLSELTVVLMDNTNWYHYESVQKHGFNKNLNIRLFFNTFFGKLYESIVTPLGVRKKSQKYPCLLENFVKYFKHLTFHFLN